ALRICPAPAELARGPAAARPLAATPTVVEGAGAVDAVELPGRLHLIRAPRGPLTVTYTAEVAVSGPEPAGVTDVERIVALRPSRYCPSDRLGGFAAAAFGGAGDPAATVRAITTWVFEHLSYEAGSSGPTTDAAETLLGGRGVCRDYAHLVATLCRALNVPARVTAVYAPGLSPMDFHLVTEAALDGRWTVWDATRLAPRQSLIRIATGRDAADTALETTLSGRLTMPELLITAVAGGDLPADDHLSLIELA
ncbi:transglutaminase-like domain-containing protein, partial [Actinoplanes sp. NPDC005259]|uniref:transglutaminase-like domain-containing protein n=1 Tax=Actinoplanes sp. NPDC005259 TaxID=3154674 RepID=UPI0033A357CE